MCLRTEACVRIEHDVCFGHGCRQFRYDQCDVEKRKHTPHVCKLSLLLSSAAQGPSVTAAPTGLTRSCILSQHGREINAERATSYVHESGGQSLWPVPNETAIWPDVRVLFTSALHRRPATPTPRILPCLSGVVPGARLRPLCSPRPQEAVPRVPLDDVSEVLRAVHTPATE